MSGLRPPSSDGVKVNSDQLAFLVHSDPSLPPEVDNPALARQKRRRTSPEDQAILEAEYQRNTKPDKATRAKIVERVALGDKEVQIWFQNRRQKTRSKALPLEEHDVLAHLQTSSDRRSSLSIESSEIYVHMDKENSTETSKGKDESRPKTEGEKDEACHDNIVEKSTNLPNPSTTSPTTESATQTTSTSVQSSSTVPGTQDTQFTSLSSSQPSPSPRRPTSSGPGYLANRRSASFMKLKEEMSSEQTLLPPSASQPVPTLTRSGSSYLRLSMTEDGTAQVIDRAAPSPNPPRTANLGTRPTCLRRSHSVAGLSDKLRDAEADLDRAAKVRRTSGPLGRSMDSRAWEFWCDAGARNALASKAEMETSGNAASAISIMRANTARSGAALQINVNRRNVPMVSQSFGSVAQKGGKKGRQPLARASTSYGRLQSRTGERKGDSGGRLVKGKSKEGEEWEAPNTDSDKENWEPEDVINPRRPHVYEPKWRGSRKMLGENMNVMSESSSLGALMGRAGGKRAEVDEEVKRFMGKEASVGTTSSGEDMDCVQSLLSLSQGNWR